MQTNASQRGDCRSRPSVPVPQLLEPLEPRQFLSSSQPFPAISPSSAPILTASLRHAHINAHASSTPVCGVLGDSFSNEYEFYQGRINMRNFVEQLASAGIANFGTFSTRGSSTHGPGYANDWAANGVTSADLARQVQGLLPAVASSSVQYVTLFIGGNDFEHACVASNPQAAMSGLASTIIGRIQTTVSQLLAASPTVKIVLCTLEELEETPRLENLVQQGVIRQKTLVLADQQQGFVNAALKSMTRHSSRVAIADFESQLNAVSAQPTFTVGDFTVNTTTTGQNPGNLFLNDSEHIGTIEQGLLANLFVNAIDSKFAVNIPTLTTAQILATAGVA